MSDEQGKQLETVLPGKDMFSGGVGFILACIGGAVGLGNIWRFPVLMAQYGGLTFLIPYLLFVVLIAATGVVGESALGRAAAMGPIGAFGWAWGQRGHGKIGRALGFLPMVGAFGLAVGYSVVLSWIAKYLYLAVSGEMMRMGHDTEVLGGTFGAIASAGGNTSYIVIVTVCALVIMGLGIVKGIERANRIMLPTLALLFIALIGYISFLPGASQGFEYIFTIQMDKLLNPEVWVFACGQAFFSLSVAGHMGVIFGSYLPKSVDIPKSAATIAIFDTIAALLAGIVIILAMATTGAKLSVGGPGLMFIYLVDVFNGMPGAFFVEVFFFLSVVFAGITSLITLYEPPIALVKSKFNSSRWVAALIVMALGCAVAISIQAITAQWMDILSIYVCPLGALLAAVSYYWMCDKQRAIEELRTGCSYSGVAKLHMLGKYVFCLVTLLVLIIGAIWGGIG